jgi:hypothetical protein
MPKSAAMSPNERWLSSYWSRSQSGRARVEHLTRYWRADSAADQELADSSVAAAGELRDLAGTESQVDVGAQFMLAG